MVIWVLGVWPTCAQYWRYGQHVHSTGGMGVLPTCVKYWRYMYYQHVYSTGGITNMCTVLEVLPTCVQYSGHGLEGDESN